MKFHLSSSTAYFRDSFIPFHQANVSIASSPVLYGLSIYSVFSANWNKADQKLYVFRLQDHYRRLVDSARIMDFHSFIDEWTYEKFEAVMTELIQTNSVQEDVLVRVTVMIDELIAGTKIHGLKNSLAAYVYPMGNILPKDGIHACISSWSRTPDNAIPSRAKINGSYVNASLMKNEALLNGYDEAIAIDAHGHVAEGTVANLFIVRNGCLITPDPSTDILEGITRSSIMAIAKELAIPCIERSIDRSELYIAEEAFMCGSSARLVSILSVDKRLIGSGMPGPVSRQLAAEYKKIQSGISNKFPEWRKAIYS